MTGSFSSLNTALSALRYNRVAMDTASQNIANVGTEGYTRRRVEAAIGRHPDRAGDVVARPGRRRRRPDHRHHPDGRRLPRRPGAHRARQAVLPRRPADRPRPARDRHRRARRQRPRRGAGRVPLRRWGDLANNPANEAARSQVLARGAALADAVQLQARNFSVEAEDQRVRLNAMVAEVNTVAVGPRRHQQGDRGRRSSTASDAGNLLDQRDHARAPARRAHRRQGAVRTAPAGSTSPSTGSPWSPAAIPGTPRGRLRRHLRPAMPTAAR